MLSYKIRYLVVSIVSVAIIVLLYYCYKPTLSYVEGVVFWGMCIVIAIGNAFMWLCDDIKLGIMAMVETVILYTIICIIIAIVTNLISNFQTKQQMINEVSYIASFEKPLDSHTHEGMVEKMVYVEAEGCSYYHIIIEGETSKTFITPYDISKEVLLTRAGHNVKVVYFDSNDGMADVVSFDNLQFD